MRVAQHGHRSRPRARATVSLRRMVAIEFGTCRSGRIGGASGLITWGKTNRRELRCGPSRRGKSHSFGDQEAIGRHAQAGMVVEASPPAALVVPKPEFLLELLVVALDAPPELGEFDQAREADVLWQGREPVLGGLLLAFRPLDQEPFRRARFAQPVVAMSGAHPHSGKARGEPIGCALAPGDLGPRLWLKSKRQRLDRGRLVLAIPAHQRGRPSPARPRLGWQRCGPLRPNGGVRQDTGDITEPERGDVGAQLRIAAIAGLHEDDPAWQAGFGSRTDLIERNLGLGLEGDRLRPSRLLAPGWIISPLLRQVEAIGDGQAGRAIGKRERHSHLAVVLLAELARSEEHTSELQSRQYLV